MKHLLSILICILALNPYWIWAQEVISTGGACVKGTGASLSWTIGEPVINTFKSGQVILTQGFHQTRLSSTSIDDILIPGLSLAVFPNPSSCVLNVKVDEGDYTQLQYHLFTIDGKLLLNNELTKNITQIDVQSVAPGNYLLKIDKKTGEHLKTFRVVKN